jgi:hypothetical protein
MRSLEHQRRDLLTGTAVGEAKGSEMVDKPVAKGNLVADHAWVTIREGGSGALM